jgi:hypothetical protein
VRSVLDGDVQGREVGLVGLIDSASIGQTAAPSLHVVLAVEEQERGAGFCKHGRQQLRDQGAAAPTLRARRCW